MRTVINATNYVSGRVAEALGTPLAAWPLLTLLLVSVLTGVAMALVFRWTSNQKALICLSEQSKAHLLAIKLFQDDLRGIFRSFLQVLRNAGWRVLHSVVPMLVMLIPLILLLTQLALRYEHRPLGVGEAAIVQLNLNAASWMKRRDIVLKVPKHVTVETEPLRDEMERAIYWRIRSAATSDGVLEWVIGERRVKKQLAIVDNVSDLTPVSAKRPGPDGWDRLLNPGEPGFDETSPVQSIAIHYPDRSTPVVGFNVPWWLTFLGVSIISALLMQPVIKVRF